jgi:hypothetical protein
MHSFSKWPVHFDVAVNVTLCVAEPHPMLDSPESEAENSKLHVVDQSNYARRKLDQLQEKLNNKMQVCWVNTALLYRVSLKSAVNQRVYSKNKTLRMLYVVLCITLIQEVQNYDFSHIQTTPEIPYFQPMMLVSIMTVLWTGQSKKQCLISDGGSDFSLCYSPDWCPTALLSDGFSGFFCVVKAAGACYQPLTSIWYQRLRNNGDIPPQKAHSGYSTTTFPVLPLWNFLTLPLYTDTSVTFFSCCPDCLILRTVYWLWRK